MSVWTPSIGNSSASWIRMSKPGSNGRILDHNEHTREQNGRILDQNNHSAQNQTALLQSAVHVLESLPQIRSEVQQLEIRLASLIRENCASKPDLEAAACQIEKTRRELNRAFSNLEESNAKTWAGDLEDLGCECGRHRKESRSSAAV